MRLRVERAPASPVIGDSRAPRWEVELVRGTGMRAGISLDDDARVMAIEEGGLLEAWNALYGALPDRCVRIGDSLMAVNDKEHIAVFVTEGR